MFDRRHFVKLSAGTLLARFVGMKTLGSGRAAWAAKRAIDQIGVQLYTVRNLLEEDFEGTIEAVAGIGFHQVEFHDYFGRSPQEVRALLEGLGLDAPAAHFPWQQLNDDPNAIIETAKEIGHRYVVLAWLPAEDRSSVEQYQKLAEFCNRWGESCQKAGLQFAYHNHDFEFHPIDGQVPFDILLKETDPDLVEFEMDLFWTIKAGRDPLEYFENHPGRFTLCHVKDMATDQQMADVGAGEIDFSSIFQHSEQAGLKYYFIEHDDPADPLASIESSFKHLETLTF